MSVFQPNPLRRLLIAAALVAAAPLAVAQSWPAKPLTWIVPFSAGGPTDAMARDIADKVGRQLGQSIVIENVAGAGGTIGSTKAARAKPDGYTFLVGHLGYMGAGPSLYKKLAYDPVKDFDAVFRFPDTPLVMLAGKNSKFKTAAELVSYAKAHPGTVNIANAGVGSTSHLIAALFASKAGISVSEISYKGVAPAINDLIGGQVDVIFDQSNTALPQVQGGRLNAIGLTSLKPMPQQYPGVAPLAEQGLPGFEAATWYGLYAPKGTPSEVVEKMYAAYLKALSDKTWTERMASAGIELLSQAQYAPQAFAKHTADEVQRWRKVTSEAKIQLN